MVTTIAAMDLFAKALEQKIRAIQANSKEEQDKQLEEVRMTFIRLISRMSMLDLFKLPIYNFGDKTKQSQIIDSIIKRSVSKKDLGLVFTGTDLSSVVGRLVFVIPKFVDFNSRPHVLIEPYKDDDWEGFATRMMNQLVLGCMMSMPRGQVRVNIINLQWSDKANVLNQNLPESLCQVFLEHEETKLLFEKMSDRIKTFLKTDRKSVV